MKCYKCNLTLPEEISFSTTCDCSSDLHICKLCKFYNESSYNECNEPMADRVLDKKKNNRCDYFKLKESSFEGSTKKNQALEDLAKFFK